MNDLVNKLHEYAEWSRNAKWEDDFVGDRVVIRNPPAQDELLGLENQFGKLPSSYLQALGKFGLSEFRYDYDWEITRMLPPAEITTYYDIVQGGMDFSDGIRTLVLEEDGIDFYQYIPIIAGLGVDGAFALLSLKDGSVLCWDVDQSGYVKDVYENTEAFLTYAIDRAMAGNYIRLA